jgi:hypothetical protein
MSHQDKDCPTPSGTHAQELAATLRRLVGKTLGASVRFRKDCGWTALGLATTALVWACSSKKTLADRFAQAMQFACGLGRRAAPAATSYQAFLKLLVRWTADLRNDIVLEYHLVMERELADQFRFAGFVPLAGDGSKNALPRTRSNEAGYSPVKQPARKRRRQQRRRAKRRTQSRRARAQQAKAKKADSPQLAMTVLHHLTLQVPWDWRLGRSTASEREQLLAMVPDLPRDALIVADCGFVGYDFWAALLASGRQFVIRAGANVRLLKKLGVVRERGGTVYLWPSKAAKRRQPPLQLRLVEVHDGRQAWSLVTSVLEPQRLSDAQVGRLYGYRWRIELFFRHFKQTYGRGKLRSHKAEHAACEAEWALLGLWTMLLAARLAAPAAEPGSVAQVLRAFGHAIDYGRYRVRRGESLRELLAEAAALDPYERADKTSRDYPRKKYEPPAGAPQIQDASPTQRRQAKRLAQAAA